NFADSSATPLTQKVTSVTTTTMLTSSDSNSFPGESVTFTATVSAPRAGTPTGSVTFKIDGGSGTVGSLNGMGKATLTTSTLSMGQHTITADYTSSSNVFANSSATPLMQSISQIPTTSTLTTSRSTVSTGQAVTFTATVSAPRGGTLGGVVTFFVDGSAVANVGINGAGQAAFTTTSIPPGSHTVVA